MVHHDDEDDDDEYDDDDDDEYPPMMTGSDATIGGGFGAESGAEFRTTNPID